MQKMFCKPTAVERLAEWNPVNMIIPEIMTTVGKENRNEGSHFSNG
jgi:hypothetical protein